MNSKSTGSVVGWAPFIGITFALSVFVHAQDASYTVRGLSQPAEIIVDTWGVPHIYAQTHYDAFFVQGFNAARDRLWQIDLWRLRGLGELAAVLGSRYAEQDKAARLFLYRGDMYSEWLAYGSDAKRIAESFTAGINAYIDQLSQHPELMPPEFGLLGYAPAIWSPEDVVRIRSNGLWRNVVNEVRRAHIACKLGLDAASLWKVLEPQWDTTIPAGLDPCDIPKDVLDIYLLAKAPVRFDDPTPDLAQARADELSADLGSNNWVVAGNRTATGRPILADDPHRGHAVPSLRYMAHLVAPGLNVIGAGEPALPGISIGHNERIAFGLTIFPIDQEDLYVYERVENGYLYQGVAEALTTVTEKIVVKDAPDKFVTLEFTRHGPVVLQTENRIFAVRAAWLTAGMSPYFGSVEYMRAQNWREFVAALNRWGAPSENQVYADVDGNIGYKPAGLFPRRENWDGLLPVPGDGRYEWNGFFDMDVLPEEYNPERGFTGTANAMSLPEDYAIATYRVGFEWSAPWRYKRLKEVLRSQSAHTLKDSLSLQRDYHSLLAREVIARLPASEHLTTDAKKAALMLSGWDANLTVDSPNAALYAVWFYRHLQPELARILAPEAPNLLKPVDTQAVVEAMRFPLGRDLASATLGPAYAETQQLLGENPSTWRWGDLHQIQFVHPLQHRATGRLANAMIYDAYPRGGSGNTTNSTSFRADDFLVRAGASFRMV
ncbi:MAG: penicillin acylase family protein, partial [Gammaproteobacteria bacterium]|nr:penicillin acylase family protein [Gammaproteobacteria bacterium]